MAKIGYARVSTRGQNDDSQVDDLTAHGVDKLFVDRASGKLADRPELDKALAYLREGDVLVITRLSRAMRSLKHMLALAEDLAARGVGLVVLKQAIDTTTPHGRLVFHVLAAIDEFQRELIVEGTHEGLAAARARGRNGGRRPRLTPAQVRHARELYDERGGDGKRKYTVRGRTSVSVIRSSRCQCTGQVGVRGGCAQPLELVMILAVWWLGVRRLKGRLPAVGHVPGAGVDGHGDLLAGGHGVGTVASTQSERTSVAAPYGFATDRRFRAAGNRVAFAGDHVQISPFGAPSRCPSWCAL